MERISVGSTVCGIAIGTLVLCANFQFGLQTGWVSMMSMPAALLGFAWFKTVRLGLTPQENVYIQSVAVAVGTGPLSFGMVGAIPAIQMLLTDEEGKTNFTWYQLMIWSLGIAFMGIFTAVLLRQMIISDKQLKFPSGSAAAALIGVLHDKPVIIHTEHEEVVEESDSHEHNFRDDEMDELVVNPPNPESARSSSANRAQQPDVSMMLNSSDGRNKTYRKNIVALVVMFVISSSYMLLNNIFGLVKNVPLFGKKAAFYMWQFDLSPAYIGQGIIMGLPTTASMMLGAVIGWAVLVPLSDKMNWAPGPIDDWQRGAQGWIMWVSLAIMVADTTVSFGILTVTAFADLVRSYTRSQYQHSEIYERLETRDPSHESERSGDQVVGDQVAEDQVAEDQITEDTIQGSPQNSRSSPHDSDTAATVGEAVASLIPPTKIEHPSDQRRLAILGLSASSILCIACIKLLFGNVPLLALTIAVALSPFLSLLGVRALGETDLNPVSSIAKLTQFVFGILMRHKPHSVLLNIVAGAITEAGAQQAGDLMQDYKTGSLLHALMTNQTIGMIVGTSWSVVMSGLIYKLYTSRFEIPGKEFRIPTAYIWADCARLMTGQGLPRNAGAFSLGFGAVFAVFAIFKHFYRDRPWAKWIPSGVAVGIGMYNVPSFTIARFMGGITAYVYQRRYPNPADEVYLVILSSGLILGEGLMSVLYLLATL